MDCKQRQQRTNKDMERTMKTTGSAMNVAMQFILTIVALTMSYAAGIGNQINTSVNIVINSSGLLDLTLL